MALTQVVLRLARNPEFPDGDPNQGYSIIAPLDRAGRIDLDEWRRTRSACKVVRFTPADPHDADGLLTHHGGTWVFHYDEPREGGDEAVYRLGDHSLALGGYVTIHEPDGRDLTYRVSQHEPVGASAGRHKIDGATR